MSKVNLYQFIFENVRDVSRLLGKFEVLTEEDIRNIVDRVIKDEHWLEVLDDCMVEHVKEYCKKKEND